MEIALHSRELVQTMIDYHSGQFDSLGAPYWLHPYRVALEARNFATLFFRESDVEPMHVFQVGLFHDVLEDTDVPMSALFETINRNVFILHDLLLLTKPKVILQKNLLNDPLVPEWMKKSVGLMIDDIIEPTYDGLVQSIINSASTPAAPLVKFCDNRDNSLLWRSKRLMERNTKYDNSKEMLRAHLRHYVRPELVEAEGIFA